MFWCNKSRPRTVAVKAGLAILAAGAVIGALPSAAQAATGGAQPVKTVRYQGYSFTIPASWPVVRLWRTPLACVRFDRHALYLGQLNPRERCPAHLVGRTEALLVQPSRIGLRHAVAVADATAHQIQVLARGIEVTATYDLDRALVRQILASAALPRRATSGQLPASARRVLLPQTVTPLPDGSTDDTGQGFDTCAAPSTSVMSAWNGTSPYTAIGIYIGGSDVSCPQPNLTASWMSTEQSAGWRFLPVYVGPQACPAIPGGCAASELTSPASQGTSAADDAVTQAANIGLGTGSVIYYDMEGGYGSGQNTNVLTFLTSWTNEIHAKGYVSGVYSSSTAAITNLVDNYTNASYTMPDVIFDALWNGDDNTDDPVVPASEWSNHQRAHQYSTSSHNETWGGDTISVDDDDVDVNMATTANAPASGTDSSGNIYSFWRGTNGGLFEDNYSASSSTWSGSHEITGMATLGSQPTVAVASGGNQYVFWTGEGNQDLYEAFWNGSSWTGPNKVKDSSGDTMGPMMSPPTAGIDSSGNEYVFWQNASGSLEETEYSVSAGSWGTQHQISGMGTLGSAPAVAVASGGNQYVFWQGTGAQNLYEAFWNGSSWTGPNKVKDSGSNPMGPMSSAPTAGIDGSGNEYVFWQNASGSLEESEYSASGGSWGSQHQISGMGTLGSAPAVAVASGGDQYVFWKGNGNTDLWEASWTGSSWNGPTDLHAGPLS